MQEWTRSGNPVPAIGEDQVLLGTPVIGWEPLVITPQAPPENPEGSTAVGEREAATQPLENGNLDRNIWEEKRMPKDIWEDRNFMGGLISSLYLEVKGCL